MPVYRVVVQEFSDFGMKDTHQVRLIPDLLIDRDANVLPMLGKHSRNIGPVVVALAIWVLHMFQSDSMKCSAPICAIAALAFQQG